MRKGAGAHDLTARAKMQYIKSVPWQLSYRLTRKPSWLPRDKMGVKYSIDEIEFLRQNVPAHGARWCAGELRRPPNAVAVKAHVLGLFIDRRIYRRSDWTEPQPNECVDCGRRISRYAARCLPCNRARNIADTKIRRKRNCKHCGCEYTKRRGDIFCSRLCASRFRVASKREGRGGHRCYVTFLSCKYCKQLFTARESFALWCSRACRYRWNWTYDKRDRKRTLARSIKQRLAKSLGVHIQEVPDAFLEAKLQQLETKRLITRRETNVQADTKDENPKQHQGRHERALR